MEGDHNVAKGMKLSPPNRVLRAIVQWRGVLNLGFHGGFLYSSNLSTAVKKKTTLGCNVASRVDPGGEEGSRMIGFQMS